MILNKVFPVKNLSFKGCDKHLDKTGKPYYTFYYPHSNEYNLSLELLKRAKNGNDDELNIYNIEGDKFDINDIEENQNIYYRFVLTEKSHFGKSPKYAYDNGIIKKFNEKINGSDAPFTQLFPDRKIVSKGGAMQLQMPDMYYPGIKYINGEYIVDRDERKKILSTQRTHVGKLGGTLDGMTSMLSKKANEGYTKIVGTPFTKDEVTSHLYWTQNAYQMSSSLGGLESMKRFQKELFRNGMNFISDASLVNEGLQGIHFTNIMKWGKASPFFYWFKTYNLDTNILSLGVFPKNFPYLRMKIINSPVKTDANPVEDKKYNPNMPTYVQIYDSRLVTREQEKSNSVFTKYENGVKNHYEITSANDSVMPYSFIVNPKELAANIRKYGAYNKNDFTNPNMIKNILHFSNFRLGEKKDGGVELWDGNVDIAKLNFSFSNYDYENINNVSNEEAEKRINNYKQGVREVQDYAILSGKYWAKLFADTQLEYAASAFKNVGSVKEAQKALQENAGIILPKSVLNENTANDKQLIKNVLNNNYNFFKLNNITSYTKIGEDDVRIKDDIYSYEDILKKSIMNLPLESLEVADDTASILSSGYLTKRAGTDNQIGLTRFDIYKSGYPNLPKQYQDLYKRTDKMLTEGVYKFVDKVINAYSKLEKTPKMTDDNGYLTDFAIYIINAVAPDITKYALLKALDSNANINIDNDNGNINFDNIDRTKLNLNALKISGMSPKEEAENLINRFEKGIKVLNSNQAEVNKLAKAISERLDGLNEYSFKLADMIVDRTESGLGLRVDAAKDIAAVDSARADKSNFEKIWNDTLAFWSRYVKDGIQSENPHAYSTAEVTDVDKFIVDHKIGDIISPSHADRIMLEKTGVTSLANYTYLFSMPIDIYSYNPETGSKDGYKKINNIKIKLDCLDMPEWRDNYGMLYQGPADSSIHSYTFSGNHDKPRILHVLGLDMGLYNTDFSDNDYKKIALEVLGLDEGSDYSTDKFSAPAIAMGKRLIDVFTTMKKLSPQEKIELNKLKADFKKRKEEYIPENDSENNDDRILTDVQYKKIKSAIARLAAGIYQTGDNESEKIIFNAKSFGERPFDVVIDDVLKTADLNISDNFHRKIADIALKKMLAPAMEKYRAIYKMLTVLPGDVTDFAGDKEGLTGFESKSKNVTQQNRNAIRWEWVDSKDKKNKKPFIIDFKKSMDSITALRKRPELSALNNGYTVSLVNYHTGREMDKNEERKYSAIFRYNEEGSQIISIFTPPDLKKEFNPNHLQGKKKTILNFINLSDARSREGLAGGLTVGTTFKNADSSDTSDYIVEKRIITVPKVYEGKKFNDPEVEWPNDDKKIGYTEEEKEVYVLQRYIDGKPADIEISKKDDNALLLYKNL